MIIKKEFKDNFKSLVIWTSIISILYILIIAIYPSIMTDKIDINQMLSAFPEGLLSAFNMDIIDLSKYTGWFTSEGLTLLFISLGIYSGYLGSSIVLKEQSDKTIEYLATTPNSRNKILFSKILVSLINMFIIISIITLVNIIGASLIETIDINQFILINLTPYLFMVTVFFISLLMSMFIKKTNTSLFISIGLVFMFYMIDVISKLSDKVEFFKYITPVTLADSRNIMLNNTFDSINLIVFCVLNVLLLIIIKTVYNKKEFI